MLIIFQLLKSIYSNKKKIFNIFTYKYYLFNYIMSYGKLYIWLCAINSVAIRDSIRIKSTGFASRFSEFDSIGPPLVSRAFRSVLGLIAPDVDRVESISQYLRMEFEKGARSDRTLETGALRHVSQAKILCCCLREPGVSAFVKLPDGPEWNHRSSRANLSIMRHLSTAGLAVLQMRLCAPGTGHERKSARDTISDSWETFGYIIYSDRPRLATRSPRWNDAGNLRHLARLDKRQDLKSHVSRLIITVTYKWLW